EAAAARENTRYLPGVALPAALDCTSDLAQVATADILILATPVAALPALLHLLAGAGARVPIVSLSKGFVAAPTVPPGVALAHQVLAPHWPAPMAVLSGPSFATEVARGLPTALTVAATDAGLAERVAATVRGDAMRVYPSDDIAGVEVGGAVKNVLAIAAGASDGLEFGHNARAALITRGLAETARLVTAMGGRRDTVMGLSGLGDLVLTCTGNLSRNRQVGLALARGLSLPAILADLGHVAEGVGAARAIRALSDHLGVDMPICAAVDQVLHGGVAPRDAVLALLQREPRAERQ
ncbi:MAG: NAD(P)H-dependent glycerol-3-phosphate dehydrogenase, partial [Betaproteobacteria bacterium]